MVGHGGWMGWRTGLVLASLCAACTAAPPPKPAPIARPPYAYGVMPPGPMPPPPLPGPMPPPPPPAAPPSDRTVIIHEADLFGEIQSRTGATVSLTPLVATRTPPGAGVKGVLLRGVEDGGNTQWLVIADVMVKKESEGGGDMQLTITDEKRDALIGGRKVDHFTRGVRVKFRWEY